MVNGFAIPETQYPKLSSATFVRKSLNPLIPVGVTVQDFVALMTEKPITLKA